MLRRCVDGLLVYLFSRRYRIWITRGREGEGECCKLSENRGYVYVCGYLCGENVCVKFLKLDS